MVHYLMWPRDDFLSTCRRKLLDASSTIELTTSSTILRLPSSFEVSYLFLRRSNMILSRLLPVCFRSRTIPRPSGRHITSNGFGASINLICACCVVGSSFDAALHSNSKLSGLRHALLGLLSSEVVAELLLSSSGSCLRAFLTILIMEEPPAETDTIYYHDPARRTDLSARTCCKRYRRAVRRYVIAFALVAEHLRLEILLAEEA